MERPVILFEMNEVPWVVLERHVTHFPEGRFAKLLAGARKFRTITPTRPEHLSPWVTWPTLHRGVPEGDHGILHFGQSLETADRDFPPIWQLLADNGIRSGVFGSFHTHPLPKSREGFAFLVPDPFAPDPDTEPTWVRPFQELNLTMSRASARNVSRRIPWREARSFLGALPRLGIRPTTVLKLGAHLGTEVVNPLRRVRRRTIQPVLALDVFLRLWRTTRPGFATFFTNHVASAMHRYWAAAYPDDYAVQTYDAEWRGKFGDEIRYALAEAEGMLDRILSATQVRAPLLLIATSMGQGPVNTQPLKTQLYLRHLDRFMSRLGFPPEAWTAHPAMEPERSLRVRQADVAAFTSALGELRVAGKPIPHKVKEDGFFMLVLGQPNLAEDQLWVTFRGEVYPTDAFGLVNEPIEDEADSTAYHVPEGVLLVYDPNHPHASEAVQEISTLDIAPAILEHFKVPRPRYMRTPPFTLQSVP